MPLLGKQPFSLAKTPEGLSQQDKVYVIERTNECFLSKPEYDNRISLYAQSVWTCEYTGKSGLTHEEACTSEQESRSLLKKHIGAHMEQPILKLIHLSNATLELLASKIMMHLKTRFVIGETVCFKVKGANGPITGIIQKIKDEGAVSSSKKDDESKDESAKVEMLPLSYSVLCDGALVHDVPADELKRTEKLPSKDTVKMYIRVSATHAGSKHPWVVKPALAKKHQLMSKFASFFSPPEKMKTPVGKNLPTCEGTPKSGEKKNSAVKNLNVVLDNITPDKVASTKKAAKASSSVRRKVSAKKESSVKKATSTGMVTPKKATSAANKATSSTKSNSKKATLSTKSSPKKATSSTSTPKKVALTSKSTPKKTTSSAKHDSDSEDIIVLDSSPSKSNSSPSRKRKLDQEFSDPVPKKKLTVDCSVTLTNLSLHQCSPNSSKSAEKPKNKASRPRKPKEKEKTVKRKRPEGEKKNKGTPKKRKDAGSAKKKAGSPSKKGSNSAKKSASKSASPVKKMKQMSLFDMAKRKTKTPEKKTSSSTKRKPSASSSKKTPGQASKSGGNKTPKSAAAKTPKSPNSVKVLTVAKQGKSPASPKVKRNLASAFNEGKKELPPVIDILRKQVADNQKIKSALLKAALDVLTPQQMDLIEPELRQKLIRSKQIRIVKAKLATMSPEERVQFLALEKQRKRREMYLERLARSQPVEKIIEDKELTDLKPLPEAKLVLTPDGLPNDVFGDVAMVVEFLSCYMGLLQPGEPYPISAELLMEAVTSGPGGFGYTSRILVILLHTLVQDKLAEDYRELGVSLIHIPVNIYTASELARLCLRTQDVVEDDNTVNMDESDRNDSQHEVPEGLVSQLETKEIFQLNPVDQIHIIKGICQRILSTYSVVEYMESRQQIATDSYKQFNEIRRQKNKQLIADKQKKKAEKVANASPEEKPDNKENKPENNAAVNKQPVVTLERFFGASSVSTPVSENEEKNDGILKVLRNRREMAKKAVEEKAKMEEEIKQRRSVELKQKQEQSVEKSFQDAMKAARQVMRIQPLGTDRNHSRYWWFGSASLNGIFVEKGWIGHYIDYHVEQPMDIDGEAPSTLEKSVPVSGQNVWFSYPSPTDLEGLISSLASRGVREKALLKTLSKHKDAILASMRSNARVKIVASKGEAELLAAAKKELIETENRLLKGTLGGVADYDKWENTVNEAQTLHDLVPCIVETQVNILPKFLTLSMAPKKIAGDGSAGKDTDKTADSPFLEKWREMLESCSTLSRLHVLLGIMEACVKWEKSAENAKCKICRRKDDEENLLLCDKCNVAYHIYCVRPALREVPEHDWLCSACSPEKSSSERVNELRERGERRIKMDYKERSGSESESSDSDSEDEEESSEEEAECVVCNGTDSLATCSLCFTSYHRDCHEPPMRSLPRGEWRCSQCTKGRRITRKMAAIIAHHKETKPRSTRNSAEAAASANGRRSLRSGK